MARRAFAVSARSGTHPGLESSVAVFIDGVYRSRSGIGLNELGEIDRVEVLRGPQGTLGGRNSSAGLISIISKSPSFNGFSAGGEATYGNYNYLRFAGNVNVPLGETVAARVDGVYAKRDGFYYDPANKTDVNDRDRYFVRGQLLFRTDERPQDTPDRGLYAPHRKVLRGDLCR